MYRYVLVYSDIYSSLVHTSITRCLFLSPPYLKNSLVILILKLFNYHCCYHIVYKIFNGLAIDKYYIYYIDIISAHFEPA